MNQPDNKPESSSSEHEVDGCPGTHKHLSGRVTRSFASVLVAAIALTAVMISSASVSAAEAPVWIGMVLVENSAEGPAFDRCQLEATLEKAQTVRWQVFFGDARSHSSTGWSAIRSSSGCLAGGAKGTAATSNLRGAPYFLVAVEVGPPRVSSHKLFFEVAFSIQKLTGFTEGSAPIYQTTTEKRTLSVLRGDSVAVPLMVASPRETTEFGIRELYLKFRASALDSMPKVEYGEIAIAADVPRAEILLDGGLVGRTSSRGPVVLDSVRVGTREVIVQDASGREARARVEVKRQRRSSLALTVMPGPGVSSNGLRPLGRNPQGGEEFWREKDGAIVVRIPGGEFQMGSPEGQGEPVELPQHLVRVDGFLMDKTEVTWGQYQRFLDESKQPSPKPPIWGMLEALPASGIIWNEASGFCAWVGGRLPTEAEWERAARGDDARIYPWGNTFDSWRCNTRDGGPHAPTPAGSHPHCVSPYGVLDLSGSFQEWCSDWYADAYDASLPTVNPTGPKTGTRHTTRGGDWMSPAQWVRTTSRLGIELNWPGPMLGFRCVQDDRGAE